MVVCYSREAALQTSSHTATTTQGAEGTRQEGQGEDHGIGSVKDTSNLVLMRYSRGGAGCGHRGCGR